MNITNSINENQENQSLDIFLKQNSFFSIDSDLSASSLYKILIKNPKLVNMIDENNETFLSYALKRNNNLMINLILTSPLLDLSYQDNNGNSYLHISTILQNKKAIEGLLEKKISVNKQNNDGNTALHFAYYINNIDIIKLLKKNNIDTNLKNNQGLIAEEILPTSEIDKIAGFEVDMNFDINIYDELKYNMAEPNIEKYNLNKNEEKNNIKGTKEPNFYGEIKNKSSINNKNVPKTNNKNTKNKNNKNIDNSFNKTKKFNKNKVIKNDENKTNYDENNKIRNSKISNNIKNDEYKNLVTIPFNLGNAHRKISNIDKIYNENDRFFRKESENYQFYAELINSNKSPFNSPLKNNKFNNNLSNIFENNNISEGNSNNDNIIFENENEKNNNSSILNNSTKNNGSLLLNNSNKNDITYNSNNNITIMQNIMINCSNKILLDFLMQIKLQKYYYNFNSNGLGNINNLIENTKKGLYLRDDQLKKIGIIKAGERAKILIRLFEKANKFEFPLPKSVYYISYTFGKIEDDQNVFILFEWLKNIKLEELLKNFINSGYFSIDLLFVQLLSNNPINDEILKNDIGIDKLGYRARILNKLKEECPNYSNKLKKNIITFHSVENSKLCSNECFIY